MQSIIIFTYHTGVEIVQGQNRLSNTAITVSQQLVFPELLQAEDYLPLAHAGTLQTIAISHLTNARKALLSSECQKRINLLSNLLLCIVYTISGGYWVRRVRRSPRAPPFENAACSLILWYFTWFHEPQKLSKVFSK